MHKVIGIDISKDTFDVSFLAADGTHRWQQFINTTTGFKGLCKQLTSDDRCVMEASGPYYLRLASYLHAHGMRVSVINPLVIRRFCQMRLSRAKTDRKDALMIARYGSSEQPTAWHPESETLQSLRQLEMALEGLQRCLSVMTNQLHALEQLPLADKGVVKSLKQTKAQLEKQYHRLETEQLQLVKQHYASNYQRLVSIPGIGPKTATALLVATHNFERFDTHKKLLAYLGLAPRLFQSGTSVNGKGRICKMGQGYVRKLLYVCAWSARTANVYCKILSERLAAKGKPQRVINIAIAAKLVRQAFAVVTKNKNFENNLQPSLGF